MPELPEVETIKRDLKRKILGKKIASLEVKEKKTVKNSLKLFFDLLKENKFIDIERIGKLLIFVLPKDKFMLLHLKMTGQLVYQEKGKIIAGGHALAPGSDTKGIGGKLPNVYTRLIFTFRDKSRLFFNDLRKFGYAKIVDKKELEKIKKEFGPEPGTPKYTLKSFKKALAHKKTTIKQTLMNQKNIAGIGNIYADEILFAAKIKPERPVNSLNEKEIENIFKISKKIIDKAIKYRGTTFSDYVDAKGRKGNFSQFLKVYRREGKKCHVCGTKIKRIKLAGRGTHFCPKCQK